MEVKTMTVMMRLVSYRPIGCNKVEWLLHVLHSMRRTTPKFCSTMTYWCSKLIFQKISQRRQSKITRGRKGEGSGNREDGDDDVRRWLICSLKTCRIFRRSDFGYGTILIESKSSLNSDDNTCRRLWTTYETNVHQMQDVVHFIGLKKRIVVCFFVRTYHFKRIDTHQDPVNMHTMGKPGPTVLQ